MRLLYNLGPIVGLADGQVGVRLERRHGVCTFLEPNTLLPNSTKDLT